MEEILDKVRMLWDLPFIRDILLVLVTIILTHFFDMRKYKKERHTKYQDKIGENIASALTAVREIVLSTKSIDIYQDSINHTPANSANAVKEILYYPSFMTNKDALLQLCEEVSEARHKYEPYLDLRSAAYLYVFEKYLMDLAILIKKNNYDDVDILGMILIVDVQRWEHDYDRHLVRRINRPHYKLFSRHGRLWEYAKKYVEKKYLLNSELNEMMKISTEIYEKDDGVTMLQDTQKRESEETHA